MAKNFLRVSKTYCASTSETLQQMDDAVARMLGASYKIPKGAREELMEKLVAELPGATPVKLNGRVRLLRTAYAMLIGHPTPTHKEDVRHGHAAAAGYLALKQDGITTWEQVVELQNVSVPTEATNPLRGLSQTHVIVRRDELEALLGERNSARTTLEEAMKRIEALEKKIDELSMTAVEEVSLKEVLAAPAEGAPELPATAAIGPVEAELPKTSRYRGVGREVRYAKAFLARLEVLSVHERRRVVERVRWIAEDANVQSLRVKPLTPPKVAQGYGGKPLCARGTSDLRIVFKPNGQLEFVDILRKGDIPGTSEA